MSDPLISPRELGFQAYLSGESEDENPFHYGMERTNHELWSEGFNEARDQNSTATD